MSYKVLIANRGEIALRALRACRELGIKTVSVYSDADKGLKHLRFSDETVCIGPAQPSESYLNTASILSAAELTEVDAIYPGYGFLAENPEFANQCNESGFKFIGPSSETIKKMGDKITAKNFVSNYGIPTVPGYTGEIPEDESKFKNFSSCFLIELKFLSRVASSNKFLSLLFPDGSPTIPVAPPTNMIGL